MKSAALFIAGLVVGAAVSSLFVKTLWDEDKRERIEQFTELNNSYNKLFASSSDADRKLKSITNNSYDRGAILGCMLKSTYRQGAIAAHLSGKPLTDLENGFFQPMLPVAINARDKSYQARQTILFLEASKLDNECLDGAMIGDGK